MIVGRRGRKMKGMDDDFDFNPYGAAPSCTSAPVPAASPRVARVKVGPRSVNRDDAAVAAADNARTRRPRKAVQR